MKRFFVMFFAVLAAIVVTLTGVTTIALLSNWERTRADLINRLVVATQKYEVKKRDLGSSPGDTSVDELAADVAHVKSALVIHCQGRLFLLSSRQRQEVQGWKDDVAAFNGRGQLTAGRPWALANLPPLPPGNSSIMRPPYPEEARARQLVGSGNARAWFDASGHCSNVVMTVSTGSGVLDANTITFGLGHWVGRPDTNTDIPVDYVFDR